MYQTPEQLIAANKASMEAALRLAGVALQSVEKLVEVQLEAARSALAEGAANARALAAAKDPQDLTALRDRVLKPGLESAQAYARGVYEVAASAQGELSKLIETQVAELNKSVATALDKAAKNAPAGA
jgi:phasin family protein